MNKSLFFTLVVMVVGAVLTCLGLSGTYTYHWWGRHMGAAVTGTGLVLAILPSIIALNDMARVFKKLMAASESVLSSLRWPDGPSSQS